MSALIRSIGAAKPVFSVTVRLFGGGPPPPWSSKPVLKLVIVAISAVIAEDSALAQLVCSVVSMEDSHD